MSETSTFGFPQAARRLGVSVRTLRHAIRTGAIPAPSQRTATATLSSEWLASVQEAAETSPKALSRPASQKVAAFARYKGTSAWRKYTDRVRQYARYQAAAKQAEPASHGQR